MPTIKDIAKATGVSHGTVSNVLNKRGNVSYAKIKLVEEAAQRMGYYINEKASALREGKTNIVAVILPNITESKYADLYTGINSFFASQSQKLRLFLTNDKLYLERSALKEIIALRAEAVLTVTCLYPDLTPYNELTQHGIKHIFLERSSSLKDSLNFSFDYKEVAEQFAIQINKQNASLPRVAVITESNFIPEQKAFFHSLAQKLKLDSSSLFECKQNKLSSIPYRVLNANPSYEVIISTSQSITEKINSLTLANSKHVQIYSISNLQALQTTLYNTAYFNYRQLGYIAARQIINEKIDKGQLLKPSAYNYPCSLAFNYLANNELDFYTHSTPGVRALQYLIPRFTEQTGIKVNLHILNSDEIRKHIQLEKTWDVARIDCSNFTYLAPRYFVDLKSLDDKLASKFANYIDLPLEFYSVQQRTYAFPFDIAVQLLFYQADLFADMREKRAFLENTGHELTVPKTYADFKEVCRFFSKTERSSSPVYFGSSLAPKQASSITTYFLPRLLAECELTYDDKGLLQLNRLDIVNCLKNYIDFDAYSGNEIVRNWTEITENFMLGKTATTIVFSNHASNFIRKAQSKINLEIAAATVPGAKPLLGGGSLVINKKSQHTAAAYEFISWASSPQIASELVMLGASSACKIVYEQRSILDNFPWLTNLQANLRLAKRQGIACKDMQMVNQASFETILGNHLMAVKNQTESIKEALAMVDLELRNIYAQEKLAKLQGQLD